MRFYTFRQNNSGGYMKRDENLDSYVIIEAISPGVANMIAESIGIYFNGCNSGIDCNCCGDRWDEAWDDSDAEPMIWGTPVDAYGNTDWIVHYANGMIRRGELL